MDTVTMRDEFIAAFQAWRIAAISFEQKMTHAVAGGTAVDLHETLRECAELDRLRNDFMTKSMLFVKWK